MNTRTLTDDLIAALITSNVPAVDVDEPAGKPSRVTVVQVAGREAVNDYSGGPPKHGFVRYQFVCTGEKRAQADILAEKVVQAIVGQTNCVYTVTLPGVTGRELVTDSGILDHAQNKANPDRRTWSRAVLIDLMATR